MLTLINKYIPLKTLLLSLISGAIFASCGFAQETSKYSGPNYEAQDLSLLQQQARLYRSQGLQLQSMGNLDQALSLYQKAAELDPSYALVFNDIGIVYEAKGETDKAEANYLKAISVDPNFLSVYSNLGSLYETKRDLEKAAYYWDKRARLGLPDDPWTKKAKKHVQGLAMAIGGPNAASEFELIDLMREVASRKSRLQESDKALAKSYLAKAQKSYKKDDYATAVKYAISAQQLDPDNPDIETFVNKIKIRALTK